MRQRTFNHTLQKLNTHTPKKTHTRIDQHRHNILTRSQDCSDCSSSTARSHSNCWSSDLCQNASCMLSHATKITHTHTHIYTNAHTPINTNMHTHKLRRLLMLLQLDGKVPLKLLSPRNLPNASCILSHATKKPHTHTHQKKRTRASINTNIAYSQELEIGQTAPARRQGPTQVVELKQKSKRVNAFNHTLQKYLYITHPKNTYTHADHTNSHVANASCIRAAFHRA